LHETIDKILVYWRRHFELGLRWNNLMNHFFVIVSRLISHHVKTTLHTLTWITLTHSYFPKKLITILCILNIAFILNKEHFILRSLVIKIVRNLIVAFELIKLASLITVNQMIMNFIQYLHIFLSSIFPGLAKYFGIDLVLQHTVIILIWKYVHCLVHLKWFFLRC